MNAELNLCKILKGYEGKVFYSPIFGDLTLNSIGVNIVTFYIDDNTMISIYSNGKFNNNADEICVYPSSSLRDWNIWNKEVNERSPKTWSELEKDAKNYYLKYIRKNLDFNCSICEYSPIEKAAIALLKIYQLIEVGYGGNITNEEWKTKSHKYCIVYNEDRVNIKTQYFIKSNIAFHTQEQADEFLSHSENIQLLKDYYMITD